MHENLEVQLIEYLKQINSIPLLTPNEEKELAKKIRAGDKKAREKFILANLRFVVKIAKQYVKSGLSFLDLIQEGNIGLIEAVDRFDPSYGYRFTTFAAFWIKQAIQRAIAKKSSLIKLPIRKHRTCAKLARIKDKFLSEYGKQPTDKELANISGSSIEEVGLLSPFLSLQLISLDAPLSSDDSNSRTKLSDVFVDTGTHLPFQYAAYSELEEKIEYILNFLNEKEQLVLRLRFGLNKNNNNGGDDNNNSKKYKDNSNGNGNGTPLSLRQISKKLGLSPEGVRRIEKNALAKLRRPAIRAYLEGFI